MLEYIIVLLIISYFYIKSKIRACKEKKKYLSILITSDIHLSFENIEKLRNWKKKNNRKFNLILCPGDFCSLNSEQVLLQDSGYIEILNQLQKICKNVLYIPGNHDSKYLYDSIPGDCENPEEWEPLPVQALTDYTSKLGDRNIHNKYIKIHEKNLYVAGFGGAVDGYICDNKEQIEWPGFPYNDEQYGKGFTHLLNGWDRLKKSENDSLIILTHGGPAWIGTTTNNTKPYEEDKRVQSGSETVYELMSTPKYQESDKPLLWIHGHAHERRGMTDFGSIPVVNPGALTSGNFSILNLILKDEKWVIEDVEFHNLS